MASRCGLCNCKAVAILRSTSGNALKSHVRAEAAGRHVLNKKETLVQHMASPPTRSLENLDCLLDDVQSSYPNSPPSLDPLHPRVPLTSYLAPIHAKPAPIHVPLRRPKSPLLSNSFSQLLTNPASRNLCHWPLQMSPPPRSIFLPYRHSLIDGTSWPVQFSVLSPQSLCS